LHFLRWDYKDQFYNTSNGTYSSFYSYDAQGNRTRKVIDKNNIIETIYYIDGFELYRREVNGAIDYERTTLNISDDEKVFVRVEKKTNEPEVVRYQYDNHLGSACLELDYTGRIISYEEYHPFGTTSYRSGRSETEVSLKRYKYCGKERDEQTGFYYYGMRYYAGWLCRFVSVDPMASEYYSLSPYGYCANNPIKYIDPDGRDPIYAQNFWGKVKLIGDDGKNNTGSYLVRGSVARDVKAATKAGNFYTGNLSESKNVMHIPTGQIQQDVQQTATATINSGTSPETRVENGGHTLKGDKTARIWDVGTTMQTQILPDGSTEQRWSITPFKIGGKINQIGGSISDIQFVWHIHPDGSTPSDSDTLWVVELRKYGFIGNSFLIDVNNGRVTFFDETGSLMNIKYDDFKRMGNQEQLK
jgi:RHS repeat-associated protein